MSNLPFDDIKTGIILDLSASFKTNDTFLIKIYKSKLEKLKLFYL